MERSVGGTSVAEKTIFTTGQVAKICKVAPRTVSKWFDSGRLRGYRIPGSEDRRIPREHLIRFLKEHGMPLGELETSNVVFWLGEAVPEHKDVHQYLNVVSLSADLGAHAPGAVVIEAAVLGVAFASVVEGLIEAFDGKVISIGATEAQLAALPEEEKSRFENFSNPDETDLILARAGITVG